MPWRRKWQPSPVFLLVESQGQRSLGYSLWSHKDLDMTEHMQYFFSLKLIPPCRKQNSTVVALPHRGNCSPRGKRRGKLCVLWQVPSKERGDVPQYLVLTHFLPAGLKVTVLCKDSKNASWGMAAPILLQLLTLWSSLSITKERLWMPGPGYCWVK